MVAPTAGEVVVIPFPFSDLTQSKVRPALCLADAGRGDYVLCQITSQPYGDPLALKIDDQDFASGSLDVESFVRPGKLFTADANLILSIEGKLSPTAYLRVLGTVVRGRRAIRQGSGNSEFRIGRRATSVIFTAIQSANCEL